MTDDHRAIARRVFAMVAVAATGLGFACAIFDLGPPQLTVSCFAVTAFIAGWNTPQP